MVIDLKNLHKSKVFLGILTGIVVLIILTVVFQAGIFVGYHKAAFSYSGGDNYYRAFGNRSGPMMGGDNGILGGMMGVLDQDDLQGGHGAIGKIVRVSLPTLVIADIKNVEKTVFITDDTLIRRYRDDIASNTIAVGEMAIILGAPNETGQVIAKLIRILPPLPTEFLASTTVASTSTKK